MKNALAAVGMCAWDHFLVTSRYPGPGEYTIVSHEFERAGGTTANTCAALGLLGLRPMLASTVGDDRQGDDIAASLAACGCDVRAISRKPGAPTDRSVIVISGEGDSVDRTIFWVQGARPQAGECFPVDEILDHRWVLLDVDDPDLREFWLDLPAHRSPRTKVLGTMIYLVELPPSVGWRQALSHDVMFGNRREFLALTERPSLDLAVERARDELRGSACQVFYVSLGPKGALAIRPEQVTTMPAFNVDVIDTTGAGDAFTAGCLWGLLEHADDREVLRRGNLLGGLACTALGARAGLPSRDEALAAMNTLRLRASNG